MISLALPGQLLPTSSRRHASIQLRFLPSHLPRTHPSSHQAAAGSVGGVRLARGIGEVWRPAARQGQCGDATKWATQSGRRTSSFFGRIKHCLGINKHRNTLAVRRTVPAKEVQAEAKSRGLQPHQGGRRAKLFWKPVF